MTQQNSTQAILYNGEDINVTYRDGTTETIKAKVTSIREIALPSLHSLRPQYLALQESNATCAEFLCSKDKG